jgi:uncharacterized protein YndB with AHSA1/START domain
MDHSFETEISGWLKATERQVRRIGDFKGARLRCRIDASLESVWAACTDRDQLRRWFADVSGDQRETATLTFDVGAPCKISSRILRCEPFHRLLLTWSYPGRDTDEIEFLVTADGGRTLVELEHRSGDKTEWWFGAGSGWEFALIKLSVLLKGDDPSKVSAEELDRKLGPVWTAAGRLCVE